ncbi:carbohydrate-binding domain-containing protein [Roseomonas haemaphysalidis]|uniref:carbohydrate-binding domain-containing protein n=1 Tax=Roseomonas haemaphysalidis TaxID=2768162 RepID=UPI001A97BB73|nr:carbohydrate-binding domain-containing protein [Roseomonas haemaphysalidis]
MAVLSVERPGLNAHSSVDAVLQTTPVAAPAPAIDLAAALKQHDFTVDLTVGGRPTHVDVLSALKAALADGSATYWQNGPLASQARVEIDLPGSQRMVFDVTAFKGGGLAVEAQFNNDGAMGSSGGRVAYDLVAKLDGQMVSHEAVNQGQYQNWHQSFSTTDHDGGQGLGSADEGWLNIRQDIAHLQATGAVAHYDLSVGIADSLLSSWEASYKSAGWDDPLSTRDVTQYMPGTGGRGDIGFTTVGNTAWLMSQDIRAATYALGQAEAAGSVPWNLYDSANKSWLSAQDYPHLWTDGRGGTGTPGNAASRGLTQQIDGGTGWTPDSAHQPDLSYVPYLLTGERWMLDNLQAQAAWNVLNTWSDTRGEDGFIVVNGGQVRHSAWALRQIDEAAWASPDGSAEKSYFTAVSKANWAWLVDQIPAWTAAQGEAHGWVPGNYGTANALPPWQQDYFASTAIAAASHGNADALTFLQWQSNFLVGRFTHEAQGFAEHDGAAYLIAIGDPATGKPLQTWGEIGAQMVAWNWSNGSGWSHSQGDYAQLAMATLAGIAHLTGSPEATAAYRALMADAPPFTGSTDFARDPTFAIAAPDGGVAHPAPLPGASLPPIVAVPSVGLNTTVGSGADSLVIKVSEQAWNGDAQFTVKVDGKQVGDVFTAKADHAAGISDTFTLKGNWGAGAHKVEVSYINDAWNGNLAEDRNLYLDSVTYNGKAVPASTVDLLSGGVAKLDVPVTAAAGTSKTIGSGADSLVIKVSEQAWNGDAQFTVKVDGKQVGDIFTAKADHAAGISDTFTLKGNWGADAHKVEVSYINDAWNGNLAEDRNLYLDSVTYNGKAVPASTVDLLSGGVAKLDVPVTAAAGTSKTIGSGADSLVIKVSEQAWNGDAQFTVKVDGKQVGDVFTAKADHAAGISDTFTLKGNWGAGAHKVEVSYINDAWNGNLAEDRNLYLDSVTYNGKAVPASTVDLLSGGVAKLDVPVTAAAGTSKTIGSGADSLVIKVSEQAWNGDAQFTVKVDGKQVGDVFTAKADHAAGISDTFTLKGNWGAGAHKVEVSYINDAWNGNLAEDRNLYLDSVTYNGKAVPASTVDLLSGGVAKLDVPVTAAAGTSKTIGSGADSLVIKVSEQAWNGDAQFTVKVDGKQVGDIFTAKADHAAGISDTFTLKGNWGAGAHKVEVSYINDAWNGNLAEDRNLYLDSVTYNGKAVPASTIDMLSGGAVTLDLPQSLITGDAFANTLKGTEFSDHLKGLGGNDILVGGGGADILEGGAGADAFRFIKPSHGGDFILDFVPHQDFIEISAGGFGGGLAASMNLASAGRFVANDTGHATAAAGTGQFIYEMDAAKLWWDADGTGPGAATEVATFTAGTVLTASDIHLIG